MGLRDGTSYMNKTESQIYDKEPNYPLRPTMNAGRIEYQLRGMTHLESRRCSISRISESSAIVEFSVESEHVPSQCSLDIPDARINKIGCVLVNQRSKCATYRFLRLLTKQELEAILANSTSREGPKPNVVLRP
jgi:hypothetical protein